MPDYNEILEAIYAAIDEINLQRPANDPLEKKANTVLFGENGKLDSLGFVNLTVLLEQILSDRFNKSVVVLNDDAFSKQSSPFQTVDSTAKYLLSLSQ